VWFAPGHLSELTQQVPFEMVDVMLEQVDRTTRKATIAIAVLGVPLTPLRRTPTNLPWG
jgi:hypothetical protein